MRDKHVEAREAVLSDGGSIPPASTPTKTCRTGGSVISVVRTKAAMAATKRNNSSSAPYPWAVAVVFALALVLSLAGTAFPQADPAPAPFAERVLLPEAARHFNTLLHSNTRGYYYKNPDMDVLIDDFMTEMDPAARFEKGRVLNEFVHEEAPWIFMYVQQEAFGVNSTRVQWDINPASVDIFFATEVKPAE